MRLNSSLLMLGALVFSVGSAAQASVSKAAPGEKFLHALAGRYSATDCEDTFRQPEAREDLSYFRTGLTLSVRDGQLHVEYDDRISRKDTLRAVPDAFDQKPAGVKLDESRSLEYGVHKIVRTASAPGHRYVWELKSEGYDASGVALTARQFDEPSREGDAKDGDEGKRITCHYARIGSI